MWQHTHDFVPVMTLLHFHHVSSPAPWQCCMLESDLVIVNACRPRHSLWWHSRPGILNCCLSGQVEGLRPGKGYLFRVRASNAKGQGPWGSTASAETQAAPPEAPSAPAISQRTSTSARCKWDVPVEDHGAAVLRYRSGVCPCSLCAVHAALCRFYFLIQVMYDGLALLLLIHSGEDLTRQSDVLSSLPWGKAALSYMRSLLAGDQAPGWPRGGGGTHAGWRWRRRARTGWRPGAAWAPAPRSGA